MDSLNGPFPPVSHAHAPSRSSSEERPCGHAVMSASYERGTTPPANDSTAHPLSSVGSSSEERPDYSGDVCRSACDVLALVPLYLEECDLSADDHDLDAHALEAVHFLLRRSARKTYCLMSRL
ncbi:hypothetical protein K438DRAFT_2029795 [Mycena galopus ATCC 62051]|nr:hypothetical protein K438DRAFT_2029795 [Mycena galopus ATCC 62051]